MHPYKKTKNFYHVNVDAPPNAPSRQVNLAKHLDHKRILKGAYNVLKDFQRSGKVVRIAGRVSLVTGAALDVLELCNTVDSDLHDADRKIGKKTYATVASIGGSWAGGALGTKVGAWAGAMIGSAILPGVGTAVGGIAGGLTLAIVGSFGLSILGEKVIEITEIGE